MKLVSISVYQVDLPFHVAEYKLSGGRSWTSLDTTIIRLETDTGIVGWGETCPFGPNYVEAFAGAARTGIAELAPVLLDQNPSRPLPMYDIMNRNMLGHPFVKSAFDMAFWDILGKHADTPLCMLLGGRLTDAVPATGPIPPVHDETMPVRIAEVRATGCKQFSAKASGDPATDIRYLVQLGELMEEGESVKYDANGGWRVDAAVRIMEATKAVEVYFEQPCASYEDCRTAYRATGRPILFDEGALALSDIVRAWNDGICAGLNLKIARVGGLTPALAIRNTCNALGIPLQVQCSGGSNITQAAIVHLAHSTPGDRLMYAWDIADLVSLDTAVNPIHQENGYMRAGDEAGLGVIPDMGVLGDPVAVFE